MGNPNLSKSFFLSKRTGEPIAAKYSEDVPILRYPIQKTTYVLYAAFYIYLSYNQIVWKREKSEKKGVSYD